jgi:hypothetical protein
MSNGSMTNGDGRRLTLAELAEAPERVTEVPAAEIPGFLMALAALQSALTAKLLASPGPSPAGDVALSSGQDRLLKARAAAERLGCSTDWLYEHAARLPFTVRDGRLLRFSEVGITRYIRARTAG